MSATPPGPLYERLCSKCARVFMRGPRELGPEGWRSSNSSRSTHNGKTETAGKPRGGMSKERGERTSKEDVGKSTQLVRVAPALGLQCPGTQPATTHSAIHIIHCFGRDIRSEVRLECFMSPAHTCVHHLGKRERHWLLT
jgi:hypothetical protein